MNALVVGDVHGCFYTMKQLIDDHWQQDSEFLVFVGDLINKGPHSSLVFNYIKKLQKKHAYQVYVVRGNHEQHVLDYHFRMQKKAVIKRAWDDFKKSDIDFEKIIKWISSLPPKWETKYILVTHAGVSQGLKRPYSYHNTRGVLHNRSKLENVGKLQIHGHDVIKSGKPLYTKKSNSWNIDTGAWSGKFLSALKVSKKGVVIEIIQQNTDPRDIK